MEKGAASHMGASAFFCMVDPFNLVNITAGIYNMVCSHVSIPQPFDFSKFTMFHYNIRSFLYGKS
jgi:hypothetical protein